MAPRKKATKRTTARKTAAKRARKSAKKATKRTAKRTTKKSTKRAAKRGARKAAPKRSTKFSTRRPGVFTQTDLIDQIDAMNPDLSKTQARQIVNDVLDTLQTAIVKTDRVRLKGIGTITKKKIPARRGGKLVRNPFSGEMVKQKPRPASVKVKMTPSKEIKEAR